MKKILLFVSVVCFVLLSNKTDAQTIDSVITSQYIECPGGTATLDVDITQSIPVTNYSIVLQKLNNIGTAYQFEAVIPNTTLTFGQFFNVFGSNYRVILVDPTLPQSSYPTGTGNVLGPQVYSQFNKYVGSPASLFYTMSNDTLLCWDDTTTTLTVNILNGYTSPYTISLFDDLMTLIQTVTSPSNYTFTNLSAGVYNISVTDTFNCPAVDQSHTITAPDSIKIFAAILPGDSISCYDADDGVITIDSITGGSIPPTPNYTVTLLGPNGYSNTSVGSVFPMSFGSLAPGDYFFTVIDEYGCDTISEIFTFLEPGPLSGTAAITNTINCKDSCNGEITVTLDPLNPGAGPAYSYELLDGLGTTITSTTGIFSGLCAGVYIATIFDVDGCDSTVATLTLTEPDSIIVYAHAKDYNSWQVSCFGSCDGEITIDSVTGGNLPAYGTSLPYLGGVAFDNNDTILDLAFCGGLTYIDTVRDDLGCIGPFAVIMDQPPLFTISHTVAFKLNGTNLSCASSCDGEITVNPSNGVDSISYYYIDSLFAQDVFPNSVLYDTACMTPIGGDTLIAIDANGCTDTNFVNLTSPPPFSWTMMSANENCALSNGKAWVDGLTGGIAPYTYDWTSSNGTGPFPNNDTIENLSYGWYYVTVTDGLLCTFSDSAFVDSAYILVDYTVNVPCNAIDNGAININTNNILLSEVTLLLIDTITLPNTSSTIVSYVSTYSGGGLLIQDPNIDTIMTFNGLASTLGNEVYELRVELFGDPQGAAGCDPVSYYIEIGDSVSMDASLDVLNSDLNLTCFGDSTSQIEIKVFDTFVDDTGVPLLGSPWNNSFQANLSGGIFNTFVTNNAPFNVLFNPTPPPGTSNYLPAGSYEILVTSTLSEYANCIDTVAVDVIQPDSLGFTLAADSVSCFGGNDGIAGIDTIFGGTPTYFYSWKDLAGNILSITDSVFGLSAGNYILTVTDFNFCPAISDTIEVFDQLPITYDVDTINIDICTYLNTTGEFSITSLGGVGVHAYNWWNSDSSWFTTSNNPIGLSSAWYYFIVTDANGCVTLPDSAFIPNGVDPMLDQSFVNHVSCFGANDGSYIAVVDSLNPLASSASPFAFWNPNALPTPFYDPSYTPQDNMLGPDTFVIQIQDALGCQASDTIIILEPELLEITHLDTLTYIGGYNVSCNGSLDGEIVIHAIGGTPIYTYWVQDITTTHPSSTNDTISGLAATYYKAFVQDNNGCLDSLEIFMTQPDLLVIDSFFLDTTIAGGWNVSCFGFSDGQATVYVSGGNHGYYYEWEDPTGVIFSDTIAIVDSLWANASYTVTVTDTNGCIVSGSTAVLTEPTPLVIDNIIPTHLLCLGGDNGTAQVLVSGATPGYAYLWDNANNTIPTYFNPNNTVPSLNDTTAFADTLRAGTYNVEVWDTNGCYVTGSVTLTEPSISITIDSLAVTQMTCFTWNNADVKVFTTGPQPTPYLYRLYNESNDNTIYPLNSMSPTPQGNVAFSGLAALWPFYPPAGPTGHVVYVEDNLGCLDRDTFIIDPLDSVYIDSVIYSNVSCNGYDDGYIEVIMPMGGIPPYQYSIDGGQKYPTWTCTQNSNTCPTGYIFSGLAPGTYNVEIWDSNMCANSYQIIITEPSPMIINDSTSYYNGYQIACNGGDDEIWFDISGGDAPYGITLGSTTISTSGSYTWTSLGQGVHSFTIEDLNGCAQSLDITLNEPPAISVNPIITDVFCQDSCTGEVTAVVSGGVGNGNGNNYTYQWFSGPPLSGSPFNPAETSYYIDNLCSGDYYIEVTDQNNCSDNFPITIGANVLQIDESATFASTVDVDCYEWCDGEIEVIVQGGVPSSTGAYTYQWDDNPLYQTTKIAIGLCGGIYTCTVTDMDGCVATASFPVEEPDELIAAIVPIYPNIPGTNPPIQAIKPILCNGGTGALSASTTGGTNPIASILWSSGGTSTTEAGLLAGSYSCFVTDDNGCTDTAHYYLDEPDVLDISTTDFAALCKGEATGTIIVQAIGGTPFPGMDSTWKYVLSPTPSTIVDTVATFTGLSTGIYTVTVTDYHGCDTISADIFVGEPDNDLAITIDSYDESCNQSAGATVYPTGGTPGYDIIWDGNTTNPATPGNPFNILLTTGDNEPHTVVVTDANGCDISETITLLGYENVFPGNASSFSATYCWGEQIVIEIDSTLGLSYVWTMHGDTIAKTATLDVTSDVSWQPYVELHLIITDTSCPFSTTVIATIDFENGVVLNPSVTNAGDDPPWTITEGTQITLWSQPAYDTYSWTNTYNEELATVNEFSITPTNSDWYYIYATDGNCIGYDSIYVAVGVISVDAISPNGDGYNDDWYIEDLGLYNSTVQLFNRWGEMLFEYKGKVDPGKDYITNDDFDWESLSIGTYYYIIDLDNGSDPQTGPLTIIK